MQGLPTQPLLKSAKSTGLVDASAKTEAGGVVAGSGKSAKSKSDFSELFAGLTGSEKSGETTPEIKTENGETLKNLLALKTKGQNGEGLKSEEKKSEKNSEEKKSLEKLSSGAAQAVVDPKQAEALLAAIAAKSGVSPQHKTSEGSQKLNVEQKIAKTSNNLDQLLNSLKGTQDPSEATQEVGDHPIQGVPAKKGERSLEGKLKTESPLEFLMNGTKAKGVSESTKAEAPSDLESLLGQKKMMTGEDYLKNVESSDKKSQAKLALMNGFELPKNPNQNVKAYGQVVTLLSDPLIRNTKDLAFKDGIKGKHASADELRTPDMKVGAELSSIKQDVIPMMHNKQNHGQQTETQTQANQKVLDLGKLNTANTTEIIKRISDYVEQNQVANKSSLDLTVRHDSLGEFKIQVSKMPTQSVNQASNLIDMQITTSSKEGQDFFVKNEVSLMKNLNNAGINLSDLRIVSSMSDSSLSGQTDSRHSNSQHNAESSAKQFMSSNSGSFSGDFSNGKEKRKELWEEYQQRYGA